MDGEREGGSEHPVRNFARTVHLIQTTDQTRVKYRRGVIFAITPHVNQFVDPIVVMKVI